MPYWKDERIALFAGDAKEVLKQLPKASVDCCVTSPPYFSQRDYGVPGQYGLEDCPAAYIANLRAVFAEVHRVLSDDGTLWLNLGDTYYSGRGQPGPGGHDAKQRARRGWARAVDRPGQEWGTPKDLLMIPEQVIMALRADGWILRNKGAWTKPAPTPDPARDRLPAQWEPWYMLVKQRFYWFAEQPFGDVWEIPPRPFNGDHSAPFPVEFPLRCIRAGCKPGGTVLDPFSGSGTTGEACRLLGRRYVGIDLNPEYHDTALAERGLALGTLFDPPELAS